MTMTELPRHIYLCTRVHPDHGQTWAAFAEHSDARYGPVTIVMSERTREAAKRWLRSVVDFGLVGEDGLDRLLSTSPEGVRWERIQRIALIPGSVPDPVGAASCDTTRWQVCRIRSDDDTTDAMSKLGLDGWEPFGVTPYWVYFRRSITG